jgi:hypothetical protein
VETEVICPYCGEVIAIWIDLDGGDEQHYVEDCSICCRPLEIQVTPNPGGVPGVTARRSSD